MLEVSPYLSSRYTVAHAKSTKAHWSKNTKENHKYKSTQWPPDFPPKTHCRESWALQQTVLGKLGINVQRNAVRSIAVLNKNDSKIESKWTLHLTVRPGTLRWSRGKKIIRHFKIQAQAKAPCIGLQLSCFCTTKDTAG